MNTLLGELATLNDVQYSRYRIAFKLRKLQKVLLLDQFDVSLLQEALHLSGVGSLSRKQLLPVSQLHSAVVELYSCLRVQKPVLGSAKLQQAQELCSNWLQMNYQCSTGGMVEAGSLKITLCLLSGGKAPEKARYMFSVLANSNGSVECCDLAYFCTVTQQLAGTLQEDLYGKWAGPEKLWRACLVFVRSAEDVEDEECDGGIRRQWLSQFEFSKLFTAQPEPEFLSWLALSHHMPQVEKVVHSLRCNICTRKPIVAFRYQCTQCNNFNLCQMCFLKGRVTEKHSSSHQMVEFSSAGKAGKGGQRAWHQRLTGSNSKPRGGRVWEEHKSPFVYSPRTSLSSMGKSNHGNKRDLTDSPMDAISDMLTSSQQYDLTNSFQEDHTHKPTMIRIGSGGDLSKLRPLSQKQAPPPSHHKGGSISTTSSGSPDSISSGGKFHYEPPLSSASSGGPDSITSDLHISPARSVPLQDRPHPQERNVSSPQGNDLTEINRKLSMELDMLLSDLPPVEPHPTATPPLQVPSTLAYRVALPLQHLQQEEKVLEGQVSNLTNKRQQLAGELEGLISQVQSIHIKSLSLSRGIRTPSPGLPFPVVGPAHIRCDSLPAEAYLNPMTPSPPGVSPLLQRKVHTMTPTTKAAYGSQQLLSPTYDLPDSMAEYKPTDLEWSDSLAYPERHRISVTW